MFHRSDTSREHQLIALIYIWFRLEGELLFFQQRKKSNQKNAVPISLPCGSPRHSPLPTGRPDSPSRLNRTKSDIPVGFSLPKPNGSANFVGRVPFPLSSPKTASLIGSIDQGRSIESCRARTASQDDPLAVKMAEGMRSTSARDVRVINIGNTLVQGHR